MLIKDLSKEIDSNAMTAIRGGDNGALNDQTITNVIEQVQANKVNSNGGPVQIFGGQSASESTSAPTSQIPAGFVAFLSGLERLY